MRTRDVRHRGFTLIEVMIVVVIVAILLAVALPSFRNQVIRGHRVDAQGQMMEIANLQQQFLLSDRAYADKATLEASGYALPADVDQHYNYSITLGAGAAPSFTITFTPVGGQAVDGSLTLNSAGVKTPADKW
ncbi:type IV pilin protein [Parahaliea aestuarii]|uniref:Prepilin-type N-terminal cleavage/methylation domain-containing protein n=1 Tax=Parahaliea aestuarii TaxID=1852021 RepID=A0A5C8ZP44_9GAMM|nr:type IV pilin protein [Parahaliea aestuarii]TXS90015.1 prepilin-type N-terminal cleavage/methylation domain-containing protein [Parahaliea aestuarii]